MSVAASWRGTASPRKSFDDDLDRFIGCGRVRFDVLLHRGNLAAIRFAKRTTSPLPPLPKIPPRVAVLKPLHGSSNSLAANLVSFLEIAYPRVDYYFGVESYEDTPPKFRSHFANATSTQTSR